MTRGTDSVEPDDVGWSIPGTREEGMWRGARVPVGKSLGRGRRRVPQPHPWSLTFISVPLPLTSTVC